MNDELGRRLARAEGRERDDGLSSLEVMAQHQRSLEENLADAIAGRRVAEMRAGDKVAMVKTEAWLWDAGEPAEVVEARRYIGCPYRVRFEDGSTRWVGPLDIRRAA